MRIRTGTGTAGTAPTAGYGTAGTAKIAGIGTAGIAGIAVPKKLDLPGLSWTKMQTINAKQDTFGFTKSYTYRIRITAIRALMDFA